MHSEMKGRPVANSHYVRQPIGIVLAGCFRGLAERLAQKVVARLRFIRDELIRVFWLQNRPQASGVALAARLLAAHTMPQKAEPMRCTLPSLPLAV